MKKILCFILTSVILLTLSGCDNEYNNNQPSGGDNAQNENSFEFIKLTDLNLQLEEQINNARSKEYPNIVFEDDFVITIPNSDKVYDLYLRRIKLTAKECYQTFDAWFNSLFPDVYSEEEKKVIYRFAPRGEDGPVDQSKPYPYNLPAFYDYKEKLFDGTMDYCEFVADIDKAYLEVKYGGYAYGINLGKAVELYKPVPAGKNIGFWNPAYMFGSVDSYTKFPSDVSYRLRDKETSIKEAAETAERFFSEGGYGGGTQLEPKAGRIDVIDLEDGYYGYFIQLTPSYKGVRFLAELNGDPDGYTGSSYGKDYYRMPGKAFMLESGGVDCGVSYDSAYDVEEIKEYDSVISFENALDIVSERFAYGMELHLSYAELMYGQYEAIPMDVFTFDREYKTEVLWHFDTVNSLENIRYDIYVNAFDGSCSYFK